jgi:hypothetical protein
VPTCVGVAEQSAQFVATLDIDLAVVNVKSRAAPEKEPSTSAGQGRLKGNVRKIAMEKEKKMQDAKMKPALDLKTAVLVAAAHSLMHCCKATSDGTAGTYSSLVLNLESVNNSRSSIQMVHVLASFCVSGLESACGNGWWVQLLRARQTEI